MTGRREIFSAPGQPEDPEVIQALEKGGLEGSFQSGELQEALDQIDFDLLKKKFQEIAVRCGVDPETINFLPVEQVESGIDRGGNGGRYESAYNIVSLITKDVRFDDPEYFQKVCDTIYGSQRMFVLHTLTHEETHAVSKNACIGLIYSEHDKDVLLGFKYEKSGFQQGFSTDSPVDSQYNDEQQQTLAFHMLNEGVVEKLAREIVLSYLEDKSFSEAESAQYKNTLITHKEGHGYSTAVSMVNSMIKKLATQNDQSEKVIWESLIRGLFEGEELENSEIVALFAESISPDFLKELSKVNKPEEAAALTEKYLS